MSDSLDSVGSAVGLGLSTFSPRQRSELTSAIQFEREATVFLSRHDSDGYGSFFDGDFTNNSGGFAQLAGDASLISSLGRVSLDELLRRIGELPQNQPEGQEDDPGSAILASLADAPGSTLLGAILDLAA